MGEQAEQRADHGPEHQAVEGSEKLATTGSIQLNNPNNQPNSRPSTAPYSAPRRAAWP
jgi:hypothetical protein